MSFLKSLFKSKTAQLLDGVKDDDLTRVVKLLKSGADPNVISTEGVAPLHWAAAKGYLAVAKALLQGGAKDHLTMSDDSMNPLHCAAWEGHDEVVNLLLASGADVNAKTATKKTALHCAALAHQSKVIKVLLSHGADMTAREAENFGPTALHYLAGYGETEMVEEFLARVRIPEQACHLIHAKAATHSMGRLPPIPEQSCHPRGGD